jgi:hypothetical protein
MAVDPDYVRLKATATVQLLKVSATNIALSTAASYRRIATSVQSQVINPVTSYVALSAATVTAVIIKLEGISGEFIKTLLLSDLAQTLERFAVNFGKRLTDTVGTIEALAISLGRQTSDSATTTDAAYKTVGKRASDTATASETVAKGVVKRLVEVSGVTDNLTKTMQFYRSFSDLVSLADSTEIVTYNGVAADDTSSVSDIAVKLIGKGLVDSSTVNAVGYLRGQDYCDFTYFAEDYVGYSRIF